jgi:preprotein translocase subunit SecG
MYGVVISLHLVVCLGLVGVVLVQSGKGGGLAGGAFGAQAQTVFGGRGATDFVTRATIALGVLFFLTSFSLAMMTSHGGGGKAKSLIQEQARKAAGSAPPAAPQSAPGASAIPSGGSAVPSAGAPASRPAATPAPASPAPSAPAPAGKH